MISELWQKNATRAYHKRNSGNDRRLKWKPLERHEIRWRDKTLVLALCDKRHKEDEMCVQNKFNSLSYQNLSSCSPGSFFSFSSLSARWFSHTLTHSNVIKAPIRAPNTGLCQKSSEGNMFEIVLDNSQLLNACSESAQLPTMAATCDVLL